MDGSKWPFFWAKMMNRSRLPRIDRESRLKLVRVRKTRARRDGKQRRDNREKVTWQDGGGRCVGLKWFDPEPFSAAQPVPSSDLPM